MRVAHVEPRPRVDLRTENVDGLRWFSPDHIAAGGDTFSPRDLSAQLTRVLTTGVPAEPPEIPAID